MTKTAMPCGCRVRIPHAPFGNRGNPEIIECPLHAAAPALAEALEMILDSSEQDSGLPGKRALYVTDEDYDAGRAALKAAGRRP